MLKIPDGALRNRAIIRLSMGDPEGFARDLAAANAILPRALNARALATHYQRMGDAELAETLQRGFLLRSLE